MELLRLYLDERNIRYAYLDGSTVKSWSVNTGTTAIDRVQLGDDAARTAVANYDDVVATR